MQGFEFHEYFEQFPILKKHCAGIFAIDTLPKSIKFRHFYICNTDVSTGIGRHWFCLIQNSSSSIECFDSLGINDNKKNILEKYCRFKNICELEFNVTQFQESDSSTCGLFTLYFIIERMHNLDMTFDELLEEIFDPEDRRKNENNVKLFCEKIHTKSE